jgi:hypothetical protein
MFTPFIVITCMFLILVNSVILSATLIMMIQAFRNGDKQFASYLLCASLVFAATFYGMCYTLQRFYGVSGEEISTLLLLSVGIV